ncbi:2-oxo acid dehydrogenase subunit E2 [Actinomadura opuntiae]|uniref:2-oxo acid dehydrogenase subunit E2 n=1 Tax=Actinomadura sp. OS1-43 TaxID=604315 RepID=UPI00255AFD0C|nr:2-oxo acid dehydrogenase subunit E2 [Actinomadura sp. OS1-43]MDL4815430.1 2-oxo acid dehydrogenase subunit E2 [Actinomadura sp. OS1-43]
MTPAAGPRPMAPERRHTLYFLGSIRSFSPVFLDTEVDMGRVAAHRQAARAGGRRYSVVAYVLLAAARALAAHPEANAAVRGRRRPRVARYESVCAKLTLDRTLNGRRIVLSAVLPGLESADLDAVQEQIDHFRDGDPARMPEFAGARLLHRLPWPLGPLAFRLASAPLRRRPELLGTFAVTSLGHRPVDAFHSVGGTTVTLGVGRIADRPVAVDGEVAIAPVMRLSLAFDHRVIDGAEAADVLADIKDGLERFTVAKAMVEATGERSG